jgi:ribonucleoside-diphosphate reductase alpha chain
MNRIALSANALRVLEARYFARDAQGRVVEDFDALCTRVANAVAEGERHTRGDPAAWRERFRALLRERVFLPNSPTLMNAGTPDGQLAACFVLPVDDTLESIFEAAKRMARVHGSGGGTGFTFSKLRPAGDAVGDRMGVASGPVAFLQVFDAATGAVKQGGRRRGANMGVMRIDHPDVLAFAHAKTHADQITNFNLSVATTDAFWHAVEAGAGFELRHPRDGHVTRVIYASELLDEIAACAWATGDPGVLFLDAIERDNPTPALGALEATNPCGELPLLPNESCNLGSLRLTAFVHDGRIDWERFDAVVPVALRFLDDVIEVSRYPDAEIDAATHGNRKLGLGVMGFADLLVDLGIPYDAPEAAATADAIAARLRARAEEATQALGRERGSFPNFARSRFAGGTPRRNATTLSVAPAGTLSILADCSAGIEPYFALAFERHVLDGQVLRERVARFDAALRRAGAVDPALGEALARCGRARGVSGVPEPIARLFPTAADVSPERHLDVQEAFQRHVDNAVSKTINLPHSATPADVRAIYFSAWRRGLKGVTVFREGAKGTAVLYRGVDAAADD